MNIAWLKEVSRQSRRNRRLFKESFAEWLRKHCKKTKPAKGK